jgi:parallel beta-helix repeat protein
MSRSPGYAISRIILFSISIVFFSMLEIFIDFFMGGGLADAAPAITIRVNTTADNNVSDGTISLREAILLVNGGTGGDGTRIGLNRPLSSGEATLISGGTIGATGVAANIVFTDLQASSVITLAGGTGFPNESLPPIMTSGVVIDGTSGSGAGLRVTVDGSGAGVPASNIFWLGWTDSAATPQVTQVSDITLRSIVVRGALGNGIHLNPARNSLISQCDVTQTQSTGFAIFIQGKFGNADSNVVDNCTVGNNQSLGIVVNRPGAFNNTISNNRIGTDSAGANSAPNTGAGIAVFTGAFNNHITGNQISGNTLQGIYFSGTPVLPVTGNIVQGNRIGTAASGLTALPNVQGIVFDSNSLNNTIGGTDPGQANIIAFNTQSGIVANGSNIQGNKFSGNSIFQNAILGIDLLDDKFPTAGFSGGAVGPNRLALRPTLTQAQAFSNVAVLEGSASPNSTIELFVADPSPSNFGSGKTYCATTTADATGTFFFSGKVACIAGSGTIFTATSTLSDNSTSEFGNNQVATKLPELFLPLIQR